MGKSGAYPRTMVVRGNAGGRYGPQRRDHAADRSTPPFWRPEVRDSRRRFRPHGLRLRPRFPQTQPAPSMRPETPPPAQLGLWGTGIDRPLVSAHLQGRMNVQLLS